MKMTFSKKILSLALAVITIFSAVSLVSCGQEQNYASENTEFYIGVSGPLTGGAATYGLAVQNAAQMAVEEINAAGGINGMKFKIVAKDDKHDPTNVTTTYSTMFEEGMQVSLGCVTTKPGLEFSKLSAEDNVFFLTPSASGDDIPKVDNGYQMCFADSNQGAEAAKYVNEIYKGQTIGVLYRSDDPYSTGILAKFKENLDSSITLTEANFAGETVASFDSQIDILKNCKFIFMPIYYDPASQFMAQAKDKVAPDAIYYGCDGLDGIDSIKGFDINTIPQGISFLSHYNSKATEGPAKTFNEKYIAKYGAETLNQFGASAYDCVYAIYNAMKEIYEADNSKIYVTMSASELCELLKAKFNGDFKFTGITGEYKDGVQSSISWTSSGYVNKQAIKYDVKAPTKAAQ